MCKKKHDIIQTALHSSLTDFFFVLHFSLEKIWRRYNELSIKALKIRLAKNQPQQTL